MLGQTQCWGELLDQLELLLFHQLGGRVRDFHLSVNQRGIVLAGRTTTYYAKQLAQQAVMQATGLPVQANNIEVQ